MKIVGQILLSLLFLMIFSVTLLTATMRFVLLDSKFWIKSFTQNNVYANLTGVIKENFNTQVGREGIRFEDTDILTGLITEENTKDFVNNNLINLIDYMNGKSTELTVYVPINKAPKDLLPKSISTLNNEMTLQQLSEKFDLTGIEQIPFNEINQSGKFLTFISLTGFGLMFMILILLALLAEDGSRFVSAGLTLILSGFIAYGYANSTGYMAGLLINNRISGNLNEAIVVATMPPILKDTGVIFIYISLFLILSGIVVLIPKKPSL